MVIHIDTGDNRVLVGEKLGKKLYKKQVKGKDFGTYELELVFNESIENVSISFILGFTQGLEKSGRRYGDTYQIVASKKVMDKFEEIML